ncbi:MAG TPA: C10 family peptidase [Bacteroidales bacterium]|nr:C10 family peptidase [Bacteroidales bacterium]
MTKVLTFALLLLLTTSLTSAPVSLHNAWMAAINVMKHYNKVPDNLMMEHVAFDSQSQNPEFYIFNANEFGFVIIAGDDAVSPILGYSTESSFTGENMPPSLVALLNAYSQQIRHIRENNIKADHSINEQWTELIYGIIEKDKGYSVNQLLTCQWDQGVPYNALCPYDPAGPGDRVYAGCVATAMAMTMYYYRYPVQPSGYHSYFSDYGQLSVDFSQSHYNYEQMPYRLTSANYDAAKIQYDCGVAVDMMYSPNGSGAYMDDALNAMKDHFGYNPSATLEYKNDYSDTDWITLLKSQINAGHPMPYAGYDVSSGHAFVCDGYSDDMFHFNWGWSGSYNGYFLISNLNPGYNFSSGQQAFINCYPAAVTYPASCGNYQMTASSGSLEVGHGLSDYSNDQNCSWLIQPSDSIQYITIEFRYLRTEAGNDVVTIYQGSDESAPVTGTYSGISGDFSVQVPGNRAFITFQSNNTITDDGFHADYYTYTPAFCSILDIRNDQAGTVNDGSNNYSYNNNSVCRWRIEPPGAGGIMIDFTEFSLEPASDVLYFYQYPSYILVDSLTGNAIPQSFFINSPKTMVVFKSNEANADDGFTFNYHGVATGMDDFQNSSMYISVNENSFPVLTVNQFPAGTYSIELCDITGRLLYSTTKNISGLKEQTEIPYMPENAGLYLITLKGNNISQTLKYFAR